METQFALTSIDKKTITYDLGGGPSAAESSFYAAGYGDFIAIEHHTMKYFGTRQVPVSGVTVNGVTFTTDTDAVAAINALDISFMQDLGSLDIHTDIKSSDRPTITMPNPEDSSSTVAKEIAMLDDIPAPSPTVDLDVSAMFTANVELAHFAARMVQYPGKLPFIRIFCEDTSGEDNTLTLTVARGFGSFIDHTGSRAIAQHYIDTDGSIAHDTITITPETQLAQSIITVSPKLHEFNITYWVGSIQDTTGSYWVDTAGVYHTFTAANTPIGNFAGTTGTKTIEGVPVRAQTIAEINFGADYSGVTALPSGALYYATSLRTITLPASITQIGNYAFEGCSSLALTELPASITQIGNYAFIGCSSLALTELPASITQIGNGAFGGCTSLTRIKLPSALVDAGTYIFDGCQFITDLDFGAINVGTGAFASYAFYGMRNVASNIRRHDTQALADKAGALRGLENWTVVINETPASS